MRTRTFIATLLVCLLPLSPACRSDDDPADSDDPVNPGGGDGDNSGGDGDGDGDGGTPGGDGDAGDQSIYAVQKGDVAVGTRVNLRGVVITAIDAFGGNTGTITVQETEVDPASGTFAYGGVNMFGVQNAGDFEVGDLVDVVAGEVQEFNFNCLNDPTLPECSDTLQTVTQVSFGAVQQVGVADLPEPVVLDPRDLGELSEDNAVEAEKWEGVVVRFNDVAAVTPVGQVGSSDPTLQDFRITGALRVVSNYTTFEGVGDDECFASVTGLLSWFFDYQLLPRTGADLAKGGSSCPPAEATAALCDDGIDNDADGFTDCEDFSCTGLGACVGDAVTVAQAKALDNGTAVTIEGAIVVGVDRSANAGDSFWIVDPTAPLADGNGLQVFRGRQAEPLAALVPGAVVTVSGSMGEFRGARQVTNLSDLEITGSAGVGYRDDLDLADLVDADDGELYEGLPVTLTNLTVVTAPGPVSTGFNFQVTDGSTEIQMSSIFSDIAEGALPGVGATISSVRGVSSEFNGTRQILVFELGDLTLP